MSIDRVHHDGWHLPWRTPIRRQHGVGFADQIRAHNDERREATEAARLDAERRRVSPMTTETRTPAPAGRDAHSGEATIGEIPPARNDGRDAPGPSPTRRPDTGTTIHGIRPTPAGALGVWLDQIG